MDADRPTIFHEEISRHIWDVKYRHREGGVALDESVQDTWQRVAHTLASVEPHGAMGWEQRFYDLLDGFRFLPAGRIQAGAGTGHRVTLFNCFVMGVIEDSMDGIFEALKEGALTMQQGGGVGCDFSTLRPAGSVARSSATVASGPVSFMRIWDSMCATVLSTGARRGAMMATLRCDHPDIAAFIDAKRDETQLRHFNLSVQVTDDFMDAVRADAPWPLVFPDERLGSIDGVTGETVLRKWPGEDRPVPCRVLGRVGARELWDRIVRATYEYAEPGVVFVDRVNRSNNLWYREHITATNPCGEIPLPPYGACDLGSLNLTCFVRDPFTPRARIDIEGLAQAASCATRILDDVIDASRFPLAKQASQAHGSRRIGLGITGLADALILLELHYAEDAARRQAAEVMRTICHTAYRTSIDLAREKGPFPFFEREPYLRGEFVERLPEDIQQGIAAHGIRNSHLLAVAPAGTISLLANNVSSGLEPVFDFSYDRRVLELDGSYRAHRLTDYAARLWRDEHGADAALPPFFVDARSLPPQAHLTMQIALQPYVDNAISKTINVPQSCTFEEFRALYDVAYDNGLKGCTTFRENPTTGAVLTSVAEEAIEGLHAPHCCGIEREAD